MFQLSSVCVMLLTKHSTKSIFMYAADLIALVITFLVVMFRCWFILMMQDEETGVWYQHRGRDFKIPLVDCLDNDANIVGVKKESNIWSGCPGYFLLWNAYQMFIFLASPLHSIHVISFMFTSLTFSREENDLDMLKHIFSNNEDCSPRLKKGYICLWNICFCTTVLLWIYVLNKLFCIIIVQLL